MLCPYYAISVIAALLPLYPYLLEPPRCPLISSFLHSCPIVPYVLRWVEYYSSWQYAAECHHILFVYSRCVLLHSLWITIILRLRLWTPAPWFTRQDNQLNPLLICLVVTSFAGSMLLVTFSYRATICSASCLSTILYPLVQREF